MSVKKLSRGESYSRGFIKNQILLKISKEGSVSGPDLREFLKENFGHRERKSIDKHLSDLKNEGFIEKLDQGKGLPLTWKMVEDLKTFESLLIRFSGRELLEFLRGKYTERMIGRYILPQFLISLEKEEKIKVRSKIMMIRVSEEGSKTQAGLVDILKMSLRVSPTLVKYALSRSNEIKHEVIRDILLLNPSDDILDDRDDRIDEIIFLFIIYTCLRKDFVAYPELRDEIITLVRNIHDYEFVHPYFDLDFRISSELLTGDEAIKETIRALSMERSLMGVIFKIQKEIVEKGEK